VFHSLGLGLLCPKSEIPIYPEIGYDIFSTIKLRYYQSNRNIDLPREQPCF
jgi:hypothetical protein